MAASFKPLADQPRDDRRQMIGAAARGATWLLLASNVQPVAGVVSSLVTNSALRLTPASVSGAAARPPLSRARMQSTWTTGVDEASGATYYYNEQTGESQWESPQQQNHGAAEVVWRVAGLRGVDAGHTLRSGDERVLSRWNMLNQKLTVSRKQGVVRCLADGTATLTSEGRGPTLWREHGGMSKTRPTQASAHQASAHQGSLAHQGFGPPGFGQHGAEQPSPARSARACPGYGS